MKLLALVLLGSVLHVACIVVWKPRTASSSAPLATILADLRKDSLMRRVLDNPEEYRVQILYTQIDRQLDAPPRFRTFSYRVDSTRYFYPASMVKMPLALLALEKLHRLKNSGYPLLNRETPYRLDSVRPFQQRYEVEPTAPRGLPTIAHDVRQVFVVSDNPAYNHLFEFLGTDYINQTLREKGYTRTGIVHRFYAPRRDNRYACPITFYDPERGEIYREGEKISLETWQNPQHSTAFGRGWIDVEGELVHQPLDMQTKNWFALTDMEKMLRAIFFPQAVPPHQRFDLSDDDYRFVWRYMGMLPRECDWPAYDPQKYPDDYVKYFAFAPADGSLRFFNKVGQAYGTMTDAAYVVDFRHGVEFILVATILCNSDGIFNDDQYEYDSVGRPFLSGLARAIYEHERSRFREYRPDFSALQAALR